MTAYLGVYEELGRGDEEGGWEVEPVGQLEEALIKTTVKENIEAIYFVGDPG